jgi:hypothetical protein
VVTYECYTAADNNLDIAVASLFIEADKEPDVAVTTTFNASNDTATPNQDHIRQTGRPSEPLPVGAPVPSSSSHRSQTGLEHLNQWSRLSHQQEGL